MGFWRGLIGWRGCLVGDEARSLCRKIFVRVYLIVSGLCCKNYNISVGGIWHKCDIMKVHYFTS